MGPRHTLIYLFRHGEVVGADRRRFIGHLDVPLSERGEREAAAQAERLRAEPLDAVFASDLRRARRMAQIIAAPHGLEPVLVPALREMAMGDWEGLTAEEIEARDPARFADWMARVGEFPFPGGESVPDLVDRAWPAFQSIVGQGHRRVIGVVAHGGTNRALLCRMLRVSLARLLAFGQDYGAMTVVARHGERWRLSRLNERPLL